MTFLFKRCVGDMNAVLEVALPLLAGVPSVVLLLAAIDTRDVFVLVSSLFLFNVMVLFTLLTRTGSNLRTGKEDR